MFRIGCVVHIFSVYGKRYDSSCFDKHRHVLQAAVHFYPASSGVNRSCKEVKPDSFGKPDWGLRHTGLSVLRPGNGGNEHLGSEIVFIFQLIADVIFRLLPVKRAHQRLSIPAGIPVHGVQVGNHLVAQTQKFFHGNSGIAPESPGFFGIKIVVGAVQTVNGRKDSKLHPSCRQFIVPASSHMSADVMTPPAVSHIAGIGCKIGLKIKRFPCDIAVSGKPHRIAMTSHSGITGKGQSPFSASPAVHIVIVV